MTNTCEALVRLQPSLGDGSHVCRRDTHTRHRVEHRRSRFYQTVPLPYCWRFAAWVPMGRFRRRYSAESPDFEVAAVSEHGDLLPDGFLCPRRHVSQLSAIVPDVDDLM